MLDAIGIAASYGHIQALSGLSLSIDKGEAVAILGPNGAGKTTLLRVLAGVMVPNAGKVMFDDQDVTRQPSYERARAGVALCPEGRGILVTMTVEENLLLGASALRARFGRKAAYSEIQGGLDRAYSLFPVLRDRRLTSAGNLSGGQQQMLAVARSLISKPTVLLLDEPSLGLAPKIADELYEQLASLQKDGQTMIVAEESPERSLLIAKRAYVLVGGRIALTGDAASLANTAALRNAYLGQAASPT